ncbi:hypothetical protein AAULH_14371 [Lactobacillus helveticus MTCC 5463]|nr:hypothetical protein AAULH_14371 [Lactobacillus helveticus MTCC 5463]
MGQEPAEATEVPGTDEDVNGRTPNEEAAADVIWLGTILELALNRILFFFFHIFS